MRFDLSLRKYVASNTSPEEIETRFEIAWSRIDVIQTGKVAALLDIFEVDDAVLTSLEVAFKTFEPVIKNLPDQTSSEAERRIVVESILPKIELFEQQLREFTLLLAQSKSNFMSDFRNGLLSLSNTIAILGIVVISLVGIISALLFLDLQASRKVSAHMQILVQEANAAAKMKALFMKRMHKTLSH